MADEEQGSGRVDPPPAGDPPAGAAVTPPPAPERPWYERRIDEVTANWRQTERQLAAEKQAREVAEGALELAKKGGAQIAPPPVGSPEFERAVNERAVGQAATLAFNQKCNRIAAEGNAKFTDFQASVGTWNRLGELTVAIVEAADETGHAADIIYELGRNPAEAERILKLPPIQQVAAIVKFGQKYGQTPAGATRTNGVSEAPPPIKTAVGGGGAKPANLTVFDTDKTTTAEWIAMREAELEAKNSRRGARR